MFGFFRRRKEKLEAAKAAANQQSIDYSNRLSQQRTVYVQDDSILTSPAYSWYPNNIYHSDRAASSNPYTPSVQSPQTMLIDNTPTCAPTPTQSYDSSDKCGTGSSYDSGSSTSSCDSGSSSSDSGSSSGSSSSGSD